jgi:hypothetical protein
MRKISNRVAQEISLSSYSAGIALTVIAANIIRIYNKLHECRAAKPRDLYHDKYRTMLYTSFINLSLHTGYIYKAKETKNKKDKLIARGGCNV